MSSPLLNTLVFQYLQKVAPNLATEFKKRHKCYRSDLRLSLQKVIVYEHLRKVTPQLAEKFHRKHMVDLGSKPNQCTLGLECGTMKNSSHVELIILSEEETIEVTSDYESSISECDSDSDNYANLEDKNGTVEIITLSEEEIIDVTSDSDTSCDNDIFNQDDNFDSLKQNSELLKTGSVSNVAYNVSDDDSGNDKYDNTVNNSKNTEEIKSRTINKPQYLPRFKISGSNESMHFLRYILECPEYNDLKRILRKESVVDNIVLHILNKNIKITQLNLSHVILSSSPLKQRRHGDPLGVKVGSFTMQEINIVLSNWDQLVAELNIVDPEQTFQMFCKRPKKSEKLKANVLGLYLSQGMHKLRLAADVFYHSEGKILAKGTSNISAEEHDYIMEYVASHGDSVQTFKDLAAKVSSRNIRFPCWIRSYYRRVVNKEVMSKRGKFAVAENKMFIKEIMSVYKIQTVDQIKALDWKDMMMQQSFINMAQELGRTVFNVARHWEEYVKPLLLQHHAGTVNFDVKRILVNHLLEKNLTYMQDISWSDMLTFPQFAGHTKRSLSRAFNDLIISTQRKNQCKREEVTIEKVAEFVNDRYNPHKANIVSQFASQRTELVNYYKSILELE